MDISTDGPEGRGTMRGLRTRVTKTHDGQG
jgi:hypothetical protein